MVVAPSEDRIPISARTVKAAYYANGWTSIAHAVNDRNISARSRFTLIKHALGEPMSELAFAFAYYSGLTTQDMMGAIVSLMAGLLLYNVMREDRPSR